MRTLLVLLAGLAVVPSAVAARADVNQTLSLRTSAAKVLFGHTVTLTGRLSGGLVAGRAVTIDSWTYGDSAPQKLAVVETNINGAWSYKARPGIQTTYQALVGQVASPQAGVSVTPVVSVDELPNGRVRAHVRAGQPFTRKIVQLQIRNTDGTWATVDRGRLSTASIAVFPATLPTATIRIAMSVNQAGAGYLGAMSHPMLYRAETLELAASSVKVQYKHQVMLAGRLVNGHANMRVTIVAHPYGGNPVKLTTVKTDGSGYFKTTARPEIQTAYEAHYDHLQASPPVVIGVTPSLSVHELPSGRIRTHVKSSESFEGRVVELQRLAGNGWQTVAKRPLTAGNSATFTLLVLPNASTVRVAMSVNQAGAGYLGATSHSLLYRAV